MEIGWYSHWAEQFGNTVCVIYLYMNILLNNTLKKYSHTHKVVLCEDIYSGFYGGSYVGFNHAIHVFSWISQLNAFNTMDII